MSDKKFNATKHGILSRKITILPGESHYGFRKLKQTILAEYQPDSDIEAAMVDYLTICFWRLKRALRLENKVLGKIENDLNEPFSHLRFIKLEKLEQTMRYINSIQRAIFKTHEEISRIKSNKVRSVPDFKKILDS